MSSEAEREEVLNERERDRDMQHAGLVEEDEVTVELLRELVQSKLHPGTVRVLDNFLSPDFVLGNMTSNSFKEYKWLVRLRLQQAIWQHPPQGGLSGEAAVYYDDDEEANVPVLDDADRTLLKTYAQGIVKRGERSIEGFQQEQTSKSISVVERQDSSDDAGGDRIGGLL